MYTYVFLQCIAYVIYSMVPRVSIPADKMTNILQTRMTDVPEIMLYAHQNYATCLIGSATRSWTRSCIATIRQLLSNSPTLRSRPPLA
jgi:hypothetical protein